MPQYRPGNRITLLENGTEYFPALEAAIDAAQREIHLETYIFADDASGRRIAVALMRAERRGVAVKVAVDGFGSRDYSGDVLDDLGKAGVQVAIYRPEIARFNLRRNRLRRLHRKVSVIDGAVAFVGGINIIDDFNTPRHMPPRFDYAVQVEGPLLADIYPVVRRMWLVLMWSRLRYLRREPMLIKGPPPPVGEHLAAFVQRDNLRHRRDIEEAYLAAIHEAREEVVLATAYFLPGKNFRHALTQAAERGVRVRVLLQGRVEYLLLHYATRALYGALLKAGVEISEYRKSFLHAKVAVVDRRWATVGSSNIDPFSLFLAREANVCVDDAGFAAELRQSLEAAIVGGAQAVEHRQWRDRSLAERAATWVCYGVARFLLGMVGYGRQQQ